MKEYSASIYLMHDNHLFSKIEGQTFIEIENVAKKLAKESPYSMLCPVIVLKGGKEIRRLKVFANTDVNGDVDTTEWIREMKNDEIISKILK